MEYMANQLACAHAADIDANDICRKPALEQDSKHHAACSATDSLFVLEDKVMHIQADNVELTNLTAGKYAELQSQLESLVHDASDTKAAMLEDGGSLHPFRREELHAFVRDSMDSVIDKKLNEGVRGLVAGALQAALVPLAEDFEKRMRDIEKCRHEGMT